LVGLAALSASDAAAAADFPRRARILAEQALRTDASSDALRRAATELHRGAGANTPTVRREAVAAASSSVIADARQRHAVPPALPRGPGALMGAFADALGARAR
jgi:hypothetical protein